MQSLRIASITCRWGGAIELSILCQHYKRQIAAYDIQTKRCDVYGGEEGYPERVMLIYDGTFVSWVVLRVIVVAA